MKKLKVLWRENQVGAILLEVVFFFAVTVIAWRILTQFFSRLIYLWALPMDVIIAAGWILWFAALILAPSIGYLLCGKLAAFVLRLFER